MNKAPFLLSSNIRTIASDKLLAKIPLTTMQRTLIDLFMDRTKRNQVNLFDNKDDFKRVMKYNHCLHLNDERTIAFNQNWKQEDDVFDESRQIWIDRFIDPINDDMFIPRDDAQ